MVLHFYKNLAKKGDLIKVANNIVSRNLERKEYFGQFVQS